MSSRGFVGQRGGVAVGWGLSAVHMISILGCGGPFRCGFRGGPLAIIQCKSWARRQRISRWFVEDLTYAVFVPPGLVGHEMKRVGVVFPCFHRELYRKGGGGFHRVDVCLGRVLRHISYMLVGFLVKALSVEVRGVGFAFVVVLGGSKSEA